MRVAAFAAGLVIAFGAAFGAGRLVGPLDGSSDDPSERPQHTTYQQHDEGGEHDE